MDDDMYCIFHKGKKAFLKNFTTQTKPVWHM
jgi:hypothetical protein